MDNEHAAYALQGNMIGREDKNGPQGSGVNEEVCFTLTGLDRHGVAIADEPEYLVRRLTPAECARLQGFDENWCADLGTENPTEDDLVFWRDVFETHRRIVSGASKPKTDKQIIKWLQDPHTDSAEYKMWGNGVALPCVDFVIGRIVKWANKEEA